MFTRTRQVVGHAPNPTAILPAFLKPAKLEYLVRLGRLNDGGYLIDSRCIGNTNVLMSLGVNYDWSFEEDFYKSKNVTIYAVDGTVGPRIFLKKVLHFSSPWRQIKTFFSFRKFFRNDRHHLPLMVGLGAPPKWVGLSDLVDTLEIKPGNRIFLKIDIEGSEYRILSDLIKLSDRVEGAVIEFHDVDLNIEK